MHCESIKEKFMLSLFNSSYHSALTSHVFRPSLTLLFSFARRLAPRGQAVRACLEPPPTAQTRLPTLRRPRE